MDMISRSESGVTIERQKRQYTVEDMEKKEGIEEAVEMKKQNCGIV